MVHRSSFSLQSHAPGYRRLRKLLLAKLRAIARRVVPPSQSPEPALRLDQLPLEILEEIFAYASTDGGPTACSLSLVSKRIHAASRATRFTSVSLTAGSLDSLSKLLEQYHQARKTAIEHRCQKPRVRHLCIVADPMICHVTPYSPFYSAWDYFGRLHPNPLEEQIRKEKESRTEEEWVAFAVEREKQYHRGVSQLLSSVAEDLETLCIFPWRNFTTPQHQYRFDIDRSDLPKLRELWTGCDLSPFSFLVRPDQSRRPLVPFPALTRLHVFENTPSLDLSEWPKYAPRIESLRIKVPYNTFAIAEPHFLTALRRTLEIKNWPAEPIHIISHRLSDDDFFEALNRWNAAKFRKVICDAGLRAVFVPSYAYQDIADRRTVDRCERSARLARRDWLERISSGVGGLERDGVYFKDFWREYGGGDHNLGSSRPVRRKFVRSAEPARQEVVPFVRWQHGGENLPGTS